MNKEPIAQKNGRHAFNLIELVVVLAIMALLLMVVVPRVGALYDRQLVVQQARLLEEDLLWLRSEAQRTGEKTVFQREDSGGYSLSVGTRRETRVLISARMTLSASSRGGRIVFEPRGTAFDKCTLTLHCGQQTRTVVVNNVGRVRVGVTG